MALPGNASTQAHQGGHDAAGGLLPLPWPVLGRAALLALAVTVALSTQLLFQFHLYSNWSVTDIVLGWLEHLADQLIVGVFILGALIAASAMSNHSPAVARTVVLAAIAVGALAGEGVSMLTTPLPPSISVPGMLLARVARWEVIAGLAYLYFTYRRQAAAAAARMHETEVQRVQLGRQLAEAQLESLRAQIEPHFLFNTLANIQRLYQTEPSRGRTMLANFIAYVRAALPQLRDNETTVRQEAALARAYLAVLEVRMAERLKVRFDIPEELAALRFPPLALSTLTENAIKHGINPSPAGGSIEITARLDAGELAVCVADTGVGLQQSSGPGAGLANLRARLGALYGDAGRLRLDANVPRGIRATITVPAKPMENA